MTPKTIKNTVFCIPFAVALTACSDAEPPPASVSILPHFDQSETSHATSDSVPSDAPTDTAPAPEAAASAQTDAERERAFFASMQDRAAQGDVEARFEVAMMHLLGKGTAPDRVLAIEMLRRAADEGSQRALANLAGLVVNEDRAQALALFEKASAAGDLDARRHAAFLLAYEEDGATVSSDAERLEKAKRYLREGAAAGDLFADALLGQIMADGGDPQEALRWLTKPALAGVVTAMERVMDLATQQPDLVDTALRAKVEVMLQESGS